MKFAVTFGRLHPRSWIEAAEAADRLGFESASLPSTWCCRWPWPGPPTPMPSILPCPRQRGLFDPGALLSFVAARTTSLRLGTYVYLLGLRHPFITARAFGTLDWVSGGSAVIGKA